jgi:ring-1,2-phenylacetyl-CoA epoxidase subunit PaaC
MSTIPENLKPALLDLLLAIADDKLMLGHLNSDWTGLAPILEEDIAFSALAQDDIAHAQAIYEFAADMIGTSADALAFGRKPEEYRCVGLVEMHDDFDWAKALVRVFFCDHYNVLRYERLAQSSHKPLADLAKRLLAEQHVHTEHIDRWMIRLGTGTTDSHDRMQAALDALAPFATWLFEPFDGLKSLIDAKLYPGSDFTMYDGWQAAIDNILAQANLTVKFEIGEPDDKGGRRGVHLPHLAEILNELSEVYRLEPNAAW